MKAIGTHNGQFHADDVFASAILLQIHPDAQVIRSRDPKVLSEADIIFDVGEGKYDHHTTNKEYRENGLPYAAFGLIWRDFGKEYLKVLGFSDVIIDELHQMIDVQFIQGIDAIDNGVRLEKDLNITDISDVIFSFNPAWDSERNEDECFMEVVQFAKVVLRNISFDKGAILKSKEMIRDAYVNRKVPQLLHLEKGCNWVQHLLQMDTNEEVLFVIYPDKYKGYRIQVVPKKLGTFEARKDLPASWAGKSSEELNEIIGIKDAIFCHPARFIAGAGSLESCMKMAELAIKE